jgi:hypothetical protein
VLKARSAFIAVLVCCACAAYAIPASATTVEVGAPPASDPMGSSLNCPWGYASATEPGLVAHGETVVTPDAAHTVLDSFTFYITQLRESDGQFVGEPRTITYKAYVGKWDGTTVTDTVWQSDLLTITTSPDPAQWETTVQTGGVQLEPGQSYALFFGTDETNQFNTLDDRGCGVIAAEHTYDGGFSIVRYFGESWRTGLFGVADVGFKASFSEPAIGGGTVYTFDGFYAPVNNKDAQGNYVLNAVNAGSAIPVKFSLGGDYGLDVFEAGYPKSQVIACDAQAEVDGIEQTVNAGSSSLTYDAGTGRYQYVWKTDKSWADSCRQLVVKFDDGTTARANFKFR